ncbi:hypothetical protein [Halopiger djelfimassiliensis]|uniref:hypothetical protein n=1 Tax=Halopiger djelfimassiliensis TaxID=1293047 RepID=UPI0012B5407B|nr:hypothetical protein [Halopiger djelfimassiliensis]
MIKTTRLNGNRTHEPLTSLSRSLATRTPPEVAVKEFSSRFRERTWSVLVRLEFGGVKITIEILLAFVGKDVHPIPEETNQSIPI